MLNTLRYFVACKLENEIDSCRFKSVPDCIVTISASE